MAVWKKVTTHHGETLINLDNVCWMTRVDNDTHIRFVGGATSNQKECRSPPDRQRIRLRSRLRRRGHRSCSHARLDRLRILDRARATPAASVAVTAVLPLLQTADVRTMRTALPRAHSRRARHESPALLSPSLDGAQGAHEL
jgi:hypothetical protein